MEPQAIEDLVDEKVNLQFHAIETAFQDKINQLREEAETANVDLLLKIDGLKTLYARYDHQHEG